MAVERLKPRSLRDYRGTVSDFRLDSEFVCVGGRVTQLALTGGLLLLDAFIVWQPLNRQVFASQKAHRGTPEARPSVTRIAPEPR